LDAHLYFLYCPLLCGLTVVSFKVMPVKTHYPINARRWKIYQPLIAAAIATTGVINLVAPILAGTLAGIQISNTATATYVAPSGAILEATSNTVKVTVAEVAGITVAPKAIENITAPGGEILPNHELFYVFEVTNTGNADTNFVIPTLTQLNSAIGAGTLGNTTANQVQVQLPGTTTYVDVAGAVGAIAPGESVLVRVPVTVNANAPSGASITVTLGNTSPIGTQNVTYVANSNQDVYTQDADATTAPVNGVVEASAVQQVLVGAKPQAFATILKSHTAYDNNATTANLQDDTLTYGLSLRVEGSPPAGSPGLIPADLIGTSINLGGVQSTRILVSDAIPAGTVLKNAPTAPAGWTVVYSTNDPAATGLAPNDPAVQWVTSVANLSTVKRVGFILDGSVTAGTTVTGFSFSVLTTNVPATGQSIENIAQVLGGTNGAPGVLVYDESGDQNPSNFNDNGTPGSNTPTSGVADSAAQGTDPNSSDSDPSNDNQGLGSGGEVNIFLLLPPGAILNGPENEPGAVGPTDNNDDFTNAEVVPPSSAPGTTLTALTTVEFTNTVNNPGTAAVTDVLLVPRDIASVAGINNDDLPNGAQVEVIYGSINATYTYNSATGTFTFVGGSGAGPVRIPSLAAGASVDYKVKLTLPVGTPLSTDEASPGVLNGGYPVPIVAFSDTGTVNGLPDAGESQNLTIDRLYVGYVRLFKEARILDSAGQPIPGFDAFSTTPPADHVIPGNIIEYRVTYTNITEESTGSGNVILTADQVKVEENGTSATNNWALDNDNLDQDSNNATGIDTSNVQGSATATKGTITFNPSGDRSGLDQATDVTEYINDVGTVAPKETGSLQFRRRIN
jgi:hypothetical protein